MLRFAVVFSLFVVVGTTSSCQKDPPIYRADNEGPPPLPPASGTAIGYLLDNAGSLQLRDDQRTKLKELDESLSARNDVIDTQIRQVERPEEEQPVEKGQPPPRFNNAPGAQVRTTGDSAKLHQAKKDNDKEALERAFALLDPEQRKTAKQLLEDRGIATPGSDQPTKPGSDPSADPPRETEGGVPLEP